MDRIASLFSRFSHIPGPFQFPSSTSRSSLLTHTRLVPGLFALSTTTVLHASEPLCPAIEFLDMVRSGIAFSPFLNRLHEWWDYLLPKNSLPSTNQSLRWPPLEGDQLPRPQIDYIRLVQLAVSMIGIGLSLKLMYYLIEQINPTAKEKRVARQQANKLFTQLGFKSVPQMNDYEVGIAINLVDNRALSTGWHSIGGLDALIEELQESVIIPFAQAHLLSYRSKLLRHPKGVLLHGPPGCGKTMLARAMARAANASFINLQVSTLVNMWYGETQKYVEATFSLAHKLQPTIIFIDELDSFLTTRSITDNESTRMIKTQFMALWDGLLTEEDARILIVGATNRPEDLDQAILRRLPYKVAVPIPDLKQRVHILNICLRDEPLALGLSDHDIREIAERTDGLSGSDLTELCREAAFCCYRQEKNRENMVNMRLRREHFFTALRKFLTNQLGVRFRPQPNPLPLD